MGWLSRHERQGLPASRAGIASGPRASTPPPRKRRLTPVKAKAPRLEEDTGLGPASESRPEHLLRHEGGLKPCPRCRYYLFSDTWMATYGSFESGRCLDARLSHSGSAPRDPLDVSRPFARRRVIGPIRASLRGQARHVEGHPCLVEVARPVASGSTRVVGERALLGRTLLSRPPAHEFRAAAVRQFCQTQATIAESREKGPKTGKDLKTQKKPNPRKKGTRTPPTTPEISAANR